MLIKVYQKQERGHESESEEIHDKVARTEPFKQ